MSTYIVSSFPHVIEDIVNIIHFVDYVLRCVSTSLTCFRRFAIPAVELTLGWIGVENGLKILVRLHHVSLDFRARVRDHVIVIMIDIKVRD